MKDYYDNYYLSKALDFDSQKLQTAITEALQNPGREYNTESFRHIMSLIYDENM